MVHGPFRAKGSESGKFVFSDEVRFCTKGEGYGGPLSMKGRGELDLSWN